MNSKVMSEEDKKDSSKEIALNTIKLMRKNGAADVSIFNLLKSAYGKYFSDTELEEFLKIN